MQPSAPRPSLSSVAIEIISLALLSFLAGWLLLPRNPVLAQRYEKTASIEVIQSQSEDIARRVGVIESKQDAQNTAIANLQSDLKSETSATRTAGGVISVIIMILMAFNAIKKFK